MIHPLYTDYETAVKLKKAKCEYAQIGIQTLDPEIRRRVLNRRETNEDIYRALEALEKAKLPFGVDFILGLPDEKDQTLKDSAALVSSFRSCLNVNAFVLGYFPGTSIFNMGVKRGWLDQPGQQRIKEGQMEILKFGSISEHDQREFVFKYQLLLHFAVALPRKIVDWIIRHDFQSRFAKWNGVVLWVLESVMTRRFTEPTGRAIFKTHVWNIGECLKIRFRKKILRKKQDSIYY
jgi:hypothetical protein